MAHGQSQACHILLWDLKTKTVTKTKTKETAENNQNKNDTL